jgi:tRNA (guanosine-2'-O-)-methyltransferase
MTDREARMRTVLGNRIAGLRIVAEALHLRHNLSAILRSAESFGVHDVHLIQPKKAKASSAARGAERWLTIHIHESLEECVAQLHREGYQLWVADIEAEAHTPHSVPIDTPIAILMGTELTGVSKEARALASGCIYVPMLGFTQSLNVSVAAACILHTLSHRITQQTVASPLSQERKEDLVRTWKARDEHNRKNLKKKLKLIGEMPEAQVPDKDHSH